MGLRPIEADEILTACDTLSAAFDADPLFQFLLPDEAERRKWTPVVMAAAIHQCYPDGAVLVPDEGPEAGAMALLPPGKYPTPAHRDFGFLVRRFPRPNIPIPTVRLLRSGVGALSAIDKVHYDRPHWYVEVVGVHPDRKGRGLGRMMVEEVLRRADTDGVPAYLETSNSINLPFYRRFGFEVVQELDTPGGGPPIWTMIREVAAVS